MVKRAKTRFAIQVFASQILCFGAGSVSTVWKKQAIFIIHTASRSKPPAQIATCALGAGKVLSGVVGASVRKQSEGTVIMVSIMQSPPAGITGIAYQ